MNFLFIACDRAVVERKFNAAGQLIEEQAWLEIRHHRDAKVEKIPHGLHVIWNEKGKRERLEVFNRGKRVGYVLTWDSDGRIYRNGEWVESSLTLAQKTH